MKKILFLILVLLFQCVQAKEIVIGDKYFITTINDIYLNLDEYKDITVTFEGNLERGTFDDPDYDQTKEFAFVYRYGPGCCFNDVLAGMYLDYNGTIPKDNSWVRVTGKPYYFDHNGFSELFLKVDKLTVLSKRGKLKVKD